MDTRLALRNRYLVFGANGNHIQWRAKRTDRGFHVAIGRPRALLRKLLADFESGGEALASFYPGSGRRSVERPATVCACRRFVSRRLPRGFRDRTLLSSSLAAKPRHAS